MHKTLLTRRNFLLGLAGSTLILPAALAQPGKFAPFSFAYVTDCHVKQCDSGINVPDGYKLVQESQLFLQDVVKQINSANVDFVLFGGDQVEGIGPDQSNWQLFLDVVQGLNCPWHFVVGECDLPGSTDEAVMQVYKADWRRKGLLAKTPYWSTDVLPGVHLVGLDTAQLVNPNNTKGFISKRQLEWLKDDLKSVEDKFTIVAGHHPLFLPAPCNQDAWKECLVASASEVRDILDNARNISLVLNGHIYVSGIQQQNKTWYISSPALTVYPCAFRIFRVGPDSINVETLTVNYPALVKKAHLNLSNSQLAYNYTHGKPAHFAGIARGSKADNNAALTFSLNSQ